MPMLHARGDIYNIARVKLLCRLAPFLIITATTYADQNLSAARSRIVDMPVVAAARFKGNVEYMKMLTEYKQTDAELKNRIADLNRILKSTFGTKERTDIIRREITLELELDDLEDATYRISNYTKCGGVSKCRNV